MVNISFNFSSSISLAQEGDVNFKLFATSRILLIFASSSSKSFKGDEHSDKKSESFKWTFLAEFKAFWNSFWSVVGKVPVGGADAFVICSWNVENSQKSGISDSSATVVSSSGWFKGNCWYPALLYSSISASLPSPGPS